MTTPIFGMEGVGAWTDTKRPDTWRQKILYYWARGDLPLTAMMSMMKTESVDNYKFEWFAQGPAQQGGVITADLIFTDAACTSKYTHSPVAAAGTTLYAKVTVAMSKEIKPRHVIQFGCAETDYQVNGIVTSVDRTFDATYGVVAFTLPVVDVSTYLDAADYLLIVGTAHPEFDSAPEQIHYDPANYENGTQRFWDTLALSEEEMKVITRYGEDELKRRKKQVLYLHGQSMERAAWFGIRPTAGYVLDPTNGKKIFLTDGLFSFLKKNQSSHIFDFKDESATWADGGEDWLEEVMQTMSTYSDMSKSLWWAGAGALTGVNVIAKTYGNINLTPGASEYGLKVREFTTVHGTAHVKSVPLFNEHALYSNCMVISNPKNMRFRPMKELDTDWVKEPAPSSHIVEGYRTVGGFEWGAPKDYAILLNVGVDGA